jgi:hypothetical protein
MYARMVAGLIGELSFTDIINGLPIEFMDWPETRKESLWLAVLGKINNGETNIVALIQFACQWCKLYSRVKSSIHRAISKI